MSAERPRPSAARIPLRIVGGEVLTADGVVVTADLTVDAGRLRAIEPASHSRVDPTSAEVELDARGLLVAPGLVDLQINGGYGHDLWSDPATMWELAALLPRHGVTAFCPTIISGPPEVAERAIAALADRPSGRPIGAEPIGLHLEGPFLNPDRRGAHLEADLAPIDPKRAATWTNDGGVRLVTLAPELPGATELIGRLDRHGVVVAAGHSDATAAQAAAGVEAGVSLVTHLFNAMAPLHHREPGLAGFTLGTDSLAAGLIVDGIHVAPEVVKLALRALGGDRLVLVTDAVASMGLPAGTHHLGARTVHTGPGGVRRDDGTLAGSDLTLDRAVRNLVEFTGCEPATAIGCASANPARIVGETDRGRLRVGALADVVLFDPELRVVAALCRGVLAHLDPDAGWRLSGAGEPPTTPD